MCIHLPIHEMLHNIATSVELSKGITEPPGNGSEVGVGGKDSEMREEKIYKKRRIICWKIVVPSLLSVAAILTLSAVIGKIIVGEYGITYHCYSKSYC